MKDLGEAVVQSPQTTPKAATRGVRLLIPSGFGGVLIQTVTYHNVSVKASGNLRESDHDGGAAILCI